MTPTTEPAAPSTAPVRVAIAHPTRAWVESLAGLLGERRDVEVVASSTHPEWLAPVLVAGVTDALLVHMAGSIAPLHSLLDGLTTVNRPRGVVVLAESGSSELLASAVAVGVRGWVEPTAPVDHLARVLVGVHRGETWFPPHLLTCVIDGLLTAGRRRREVASVLDTLSERENEILQCLARGLTRQEIAQLYFVSPHTVRTHVNNLLRKLDVHSTLAAISLARELRPDDGDTRPDQTAG